MKNMISIKMVRMSLAVFAAAACCMALLFNAGCEVSSADASINISPSAAQVGHVGHSITLTANGGYVYTWSLDNNTWGTLNTYQGNQVIYTSRYLPTDLDVVQVIRVSSRFSDGEHSGTGGSSTNSASTSIVHSAEAYITHLSVPSATN